MTNAHANTLNPDVASGTARETEPKQKPESIKVFDVGINESLPLSQLGLLGLQNVFGMTGMFVFPGILGRAFNLAPEQIAYVYGMTFIACGIITVLQSVWLLRLPIAQGPYAGSFGALMAVGHLQGGGGLGTAYGSFFVASLIWCALTIPIKGRSCIGFFARHIRLPIISGMIVMLIMIQISSVALPAWIGQRTSPGFPLINLLSGAVAVIGIIIATLWGGRLRRGAILIGIAAGTLCYTVFSPISFAAVASAPLMVEPHIFPFGFGVNVDLVVVFLLVLIPAGMGSMALYQTVAEWGDEPLSAGRMSEGLFGVAIGSVIAAVFGGFSTVAYPDNIGILRATRVGSRYVTLTAGLFLIILGGCIKFDMLLVLVPLPVISAAATLLFGIVFMHGVHMLAKVEWNDRRLICTGLSFLIGLGGLFIAPEVLHTMPLMMQLVLQQPVISGGLTLVILHTLLCGGDQAPVPSKA